MTVYNPAAEADAERRRHHEVAAIADNAAAIALKRIPVRVPSALA